jgi:hypothetical protein
MCHAQWMFEKIKTNKKFSRFKKKKIFPNADVISDWEVLIAVWLIFHHNKTLCIIYFSCFVFTPNKKVMLYVLKLKWWLMKRKNSAKLSTFSINLLILNKNIESPQIELEYIKYFWQHNNYEFKTLSISY